jgi:cytochrome oxidase Cu insertion factor (SCO1/SenC/PrrC family)
MFSSFLSILVLGLGVFLTGVGRAPEPQADRSASRVDVETVGPKVGDGLPDFSLRDQHGEVRSLKSVLGPNGAIIVFFRSADW